MHTPSSVPVRREGEVRGVDKHFRLCMSLVHYWVEGG